jgi:GMP synthase-like glutamine amidotransferase
VFLSNGPGDPAATGAYAVPVIAGLLERDIPLFGICLGHQLLGIAAGATTTKMNQGHRGANHPVLRKADGVVEITSMNHGFAVDKASLPEGVEETHVSLFDGSNCGIAITGKRAFGVQYHPEASPGPQDSFYLFDERSSSICRATTMNWKLIDRSQRSMNRWRGHTHSETLTLMMLRKLTIRNMLGRFWIRWRLTGYSKHGWAKGTTRGPIDQLIKEYMSDLLKTCHWF